MALQTSDPSAAVITSVGSVGNGGTISSTTPVITGTADAGDIVSVYDGVRLLGTALVDVNGKWSFTPTVALKLGAHSFAAIPQDSKGNFGASSATVGVQVASNVAPTPAITNVLDTIGTNAALVSIPSGGATSGNQPTVSGTGTAGATIYIYQNGAGCGTAVVDVTGHWSAKIPAAMTDGVHAMTAVQMGTGGQGASASSASWTITINTTTPATPAAPTTTDDNGNAIPAGGTTADPHPHIHGKGTNGDTITVYDNGVVIGSTTVAGDGTWSFTPSPDLPSGNNSITVIETNPAGTSSASSTPIVVVVDTTTPAKPSTPVLTDDSNASIPAGSTSSDDHPHISGTGTAGNIVNVYDGATPIGSAVVDVTGKWTFTPSTDMASGTHSITATQTNAAGTTGAASAAIAFTFTPVATVPVITLLHEYNGLNDVKSVPSGSTTPYTGNVIYGTAHYGDTISVYDGAKLLGSVGVSIDGSWWIGSGITWASGVHTITATAKTTTGLTSTVSNTFTFTVNTSTPATPAAPTMTDDSGHAIAAGSSTADPHPHIAGTGTAGDIITVYDNSAIIGSTTIGKDGTWSFTPSTDMANGSNSITVIETNPAGTPSASSTPVIVVVDTTTPAKPSTPVLTDDAGLAITSASPDGHPHISGTGTTGNIVKIYDGAAMIGSAVVDGAGKWTFMPATDLANGAHSFTATQTNAAGTTGAASAAVAFTFAPPPVITNVVDTFGTSPTLVTIPDGGATNGNQPTISGTGVPGDTVYIYASGRGVGDMIIPPSGIWSIQVNKGLYEGTNIMTATQFPAGQAQSVASNSWTITINTGTPATPAAPTMTDDSGNAIAAGSTTADPHPHIAGTGTAGDTITVSDNGVVIGSTTIGKDGTWSFTPTTDMAGGNNSITVIETNPAGTPSAASTPVVITVVTTAPATPAAPTFTDDLGGIIPAGSTTPDAAPHINGKGTAGDIITVYDGATVLGTAVVQTDGTWTFQPTTALSPSTAHSITVTESNAAGASAHSAASSVTISSAGIVITGVYDSSGHLIANGGSNTGAFTVEGTVTGYGNGDRILIGFTAGVVGISAASYVTVTVINGTFSYTFDKNTTDDSGHPFFPAIAASCTFTAVAEHSNAVTYATSTSYTVNETSWTSNVPVPATPAAPAFSDDLGAAIPAGSTTGDASPHISGKGASGDIITVYDGATVLGTTVVKPDGTWTFQPAALATSTAHSISVTESNAAGTSAHSAASSVTIGAPSVAITGVYDQNGHSIANGASNTGSFTVTGTVNGYGNGDRVNIGFTAGSLNSSSAKTFVTVVVNNGTFSFTFNTATTDSNGLLFFSGYASSYTFYAAAQHISSAPVTYATSASYTVNETSWTYSGTTTVPATPAAPAAPTFSDDSGAAIPAGSTTTDAAPHINGKGSFGDTITVYDGATVLGTTVVKADGTWTFQPSTALSNAAHSITVTESNAAGTSAKSAASSVTIDPSSIAITGVYDQDGHLIARGGSMTGTITVKGTVSGYVTGDQVMLEIAGQAVAHSNVARQQVFLTIASDGTFSYTYNSASKNYNGDPLFLGTAGSVSIQASAGHAAYAFYATSTVYTVNETSWTYSAPVVPATPVAPTFTDDLGAAIPAGSATLDAAPHINGKGTAGDIITVYDGATVLGTAVVNPDGTWTFQPATALSSATHSISVTESNVAGTSAQSPNVSLVVGVIAVPSFSSINYTGSDGNRFTIADGGNVPIDYQSVNLGGQGTVGATIKIYDGSTLVASGVVSATGYWNAGFNTSTLPMGTHSFSATQTPTGGSESAHSAAHPFTVGTTTVGTLVFDSVGYTDMYGQRHTFPVAGNVPISYQSVNLGGEGTAGATIKIYDGSTLLASSVVAVTGNWNGGFSGGVLALGAHSLSVTQTTTGGTESAHTTALTINVVATVSSSMQPTTQDATDDTAQAAAGVDSTQPDHHTVVGEHDAFVGTAANGNETVDLNADPASYFKETTAHIQGSGGTAIDTLHLTGDHQVLDLTSLTGQTAAAKISGIEVIDLGGHTNNLKLSLTDVLNLGEQDLFQKDGHQQLMVKGSNGDTVDLSNAHIAGVADGQWQAEGTAVVGGVTYNVYEHSGAHTELLVQQGVQIALHN
ncbi:Ig-like domain-containing protein [Caballeronia sp. dw_19]|uniref:Ig-like domain-containing protein n=1 Tax=Caballeronia sp. dw_19 TaxID=2719791 RepID=UPI001BD5AA34|nr:Ig-like domain-containing protein [Caballeronia sp. dw_19]